MEFHYTKYYKLVIFIVGMTFILSLGSSYCSNFTVAETDHIATKRTIGETKRGFHIIVHIAINVRQGDGILTFIWKEGMVNHQADTWPATLYNRNIQSDQFGSATVADSIGNTFEPIYIPQQTPLATSHH